MILIYYEEKGGPLTVDEIDGNFRNLADRLDAIETTSERVVSVEQNGNTFNLVTDRGTVIEPALTIPDGPTGAPGEAGAAGSGWFLAAGAPSASNPPPGFREGVDIYMDTSTGEYFKLEAGSFVKKGQLSGGGTGGGGASTAAEVSFNFETAGLSTAASNVQYAIEETLGRIDSAKTSANVYTDNKIASLLAGAPAALDTLNELANALGDDANFSATITANLTDLEGRVSTLESSGGGSGGGGSTAAYDLIWPQAEDQLYSQAEQDAFTIFTNWNQKNLIRFGMVKLEEEVAAAKASTGFIGNFDANGLYSSNEVTGHKVLENATDRMSLKHGILRLDEVLGPVEERTRGLDYDINSQITHILDQWGNRALTVTRDGVGVGTDNPEYDFHVRKGGFMGFGLETSTDGSDAVFYLKNGGPTNPGTWSLHIDNSNDNILDYRFDNTRRMMMTKLGGVASWADMSESAAHAYYKNGVRNGSSFYTKYFENDVAIGSISYDGTQTRFNTASDVRLKENILPAPSNTGEIVDAIEVKSFDFKHSGGHLDFGFIAQDLHKIYPQAVTPGDAESPAEIDEIWQVDHASLVPLLLKEIQDLRARLTAAGL